MGNVDFALSVEVEKIVEELEELFERGLVDKVPQLLRSIDANYMPDLFERLSLEYRSALAPLLPNEVIVEFISKLQQEILHDFVKGLPISRLIKIASELPADELADLVSRLPSNVRRSLYKELPYWKLEEVRPLLGYPPETAGGLMTNRIPMFYKEDTIGEALEEFTLTLKFNRYDTTNYFYVVDKGEIFLGWIKVTEGITAPKDRKLKDLIRRPPTTLPDVDQEEVAKMVARYDLEEIPVVDKKGRLLGAITADDVIDVIISEASEDIIKFGGTVELENSYLVAKIGDLVRRRAVWIILLYMLESVTANVLKVFESELASVVALSFFIPLLISSGGNVGSQSATLVIRALALGEITIRDLLRVLFKESLTALGLGLVLSPVAFGIAYTISWNLKLGLVVAFAVILIIYMASIVGGLLPFLAKVLKLDPAVISAPLISTLSDVIGLTLYFTLALLLLGI